MVHRFIEERSDLEGHITIVVSFDTSGGVCEAVIETIESLMVLFEIFFQGNSLPVIIDFVRFFGFFAETIYEPMVFRSGTILFVADAALDFVYVFKVELSRVINKIVSFGFVNRQIIG